MDRHASVANRADPRGAVRHGTEGARAFLIGAVAGPILDVGGIQTGLLRGIAAGLIALPVAAVLAAVVLLVRKVIQKHRVEPIDGAMFALDLVVAFGAAFVGILAFDAVEMVVGLHLDPQG